MSASLEIFERAFPLLSSPDYFDVSVVYRMENVDGRGPIVGQAARAASLLNHFKGHLLPHEGISLNRQKYPEHELFSRERYLPMLKAGAFGWRSRALYDAFFIDDGEILCNAAGFYLVEYRPQTFIPMPDGQVLFLK